MAKQPRDYIDPIKAALAAKALKEGLQLVGEDDQLLLDMIEGETDFMETLDALLFRMIGNTGLVQGVKAAMTELETRAARFSKRIETDRGLIEQAIMIAEIDSKIERPLATIFLSKRGPKLIIETESDIPAEFWKTPDPVLDRKALTDALKVRADAVAALPEDKEELMVAIKALPPEIPGATLSNSAPSLAIRIS